MMEYFIWIYLGIINFIGFLIMGIDKWKAKRKAWRIPEKTFFMVSLLGGGLGCWGGMYTFRHKTKHLKFTLGVPAILVGQIVVSFLLLR
jgi:uncharacterized membrane protein YsdA (DUF1294 family)